MGLRPDPPDSAVVPELQDHRVAEAEPPTLPSPMITRMFPSPISVCHCRPLMLPYTAAGGTRRSSVPETPYDPRGVKRVRRRERASPSAHRCHSLRMPSHIARLHQSCRYRSTTPGQLASARRSTGTRPESLDAQVGAQPGCGGGRFGQDAAAISSSSETERTRTPAPARCPPGLLGSALDVGVCV